MSSPAKVQPPGLEAPLDRPARQAELGELPARHDAVLACCEGRDAGVGPARSTFTTAMGVKVERGRHAWHRGDEFVTAKPLDRDTCVAAS
jgi:hypothetical protein